MALAGNRGRAFKHETPTGLHDRLVRCERGRAGMSHFAYTRTSAFLGHDDCGHFIIVDSANWGRSI